MRATGGWVAAGRPGAPRLLEVGPTHGSRHKPRQCLRRASHIPAYTYLYSGHDVGDELHRIPSPLRRGTGAVTNDRQEVIITRSGHDPVVIVSLADYESRRETAYLMRSPANARRLLDAMERLEAGRGQTNDRIETKASANRKRSDATSPAVGPGESPTIITSCTRPPATRSTSPPRRNGTSHQDAAMLASALVVEASRPTGAGRVSRRDFAVSAVSRTAQDPARRRRRGDRWRRMSRRR